MERNGHDKREEARQIYASCRSKLYRKLVVCALLFKNAFLSLHSYSCKQLLRKSHADSKFEHHNEGYRKKTPYIEAVIA